MLAIKNDSISCELGIRYPVLQAIFSGRKKTPESDGTHTLYVAYHMISSAISYTISYAIMRTETNTSKK